MYYDDSIIEDVRAANDIVDVVSQTVQLTKRGSNYFGLCPFHNEKTPSFSVSPVKQMYYCFGCGAGGNVFTYVQKYDNLTWTEAVKQLADRAHITLPEAGDPEKARQKTDKRKRLLEANKEAATWYYYQLRSQKGETGMAYLTKRGLSEETIKRFGLGFAPLSRDLLVRYLREKGFQDAEIVDAGLAVREEKSGLRDKFWNRVMFPIQDVQGRVIGFGGRVMGEGEPKYLNSPETLIFDKSRNLYGLMYAKGTRKGRFILCEGYLDVIAMHQAGFAEAVASLGTSFTDGQAALLKRYTQEAVLAYDSDGAGINAAQRAIRILRGAGIRPKVMRLAPHKDPDEFLKQEDAAEMEKRIREAENAFLFEISVVERGYRMEDPAERAAFYREMASRLAATFPEALERETYIQTLGARYHIDPQELKEAAARMPVSGQRSSTGPKDSVYVRAREARSEAGVKSQKMLLSWLAERPGDYALIADDVSVTDFSDPFCRRVAEIVFPAIRERRFFAASVQDVFETEEEREQCALILNTPLSIGDTDAERAQALHDIVYDVLKRSYDDMRANADPSDPAYLNRTIEGKQRLERFSRKRMQG
ncbi:MAG: DNA primase [Lachnospiraceae bacterium]|nr:DNA primase [Lachnospiraceae bacterium]